MSQIQTRYEDPGDFSKEKELSGLTFHPTRGKADHYTEPATEKGLIYAVRRAYEADIPVSVIGMGTHTVISDEGVRGLLVSTRRLKGITVKGNLITAMAGESLDDVINAGLDRNLSGLEGLGGIPGTIAAALWINAESGGMNLSSHLLYFDYVDHKGRVHRRPNYADMYGRHETRIGEDEIILSVTLALTPERRTAEKRVEKERNIELMFVPPTARFLAKVFKCRSANPDALLESTDLRCDDFRKCRFSPDEPNYILCSKDCSIKEILELMIRAKDKVRKERGVSLLPSYAFLGEFNADLEARLAVLREDAEALR